MIKSVILVALVAAAAALGWAVAQQQQNIEVRIAARSVADGRVEFGVLYEGERLLPSSRYLSARLADARDDRWLRSSPVRIELDAAPTQLAAPPDAERIEGRGEDVQALRLAAGVWYCSASIEGNDGRFYGFVFRGREGGHETITGIAAAGDARKLIRVGSGILDFKGVIDVEIDAQPSASWSVGCERQQ